MKTLYIFAYVSIGMAMAAAIGSFTINQHQTASVEGTYHVKVVNQEINLSGPNRLLIEKDGQRMRCDEPSASDVSNKTPLNCDAVTKINADK